MQKGNYADADVYAGSMRQPTSHFARSFWQPRQFVLGPLLHILRAGKLKYFPEKVGVTFAPILLGKSICQGFTQPAACLTMRGKRRSGTPNDTDATRTHARWADGRQSRIIFVFRMQMRLATRGSLLLCILQ